MSVSYGGSARVDFRFSEADLIANNPLELIAPTDGFVNALDAIVQKAVTTGGTLTVRNWTTGAAVAVTGLSATIPNGAAKGSRPTVNTPATAGAASRAVKKGDRLQVFPAGFATAGDVWGILSFDSIDKRGAALPA